MALQRIRASPKLMCVLIERGQGCTYNAEVKHLPNMFDSEGVGAKSPEAKPNIGRDQAKRTRDWRMHL